MQSMNGSTPDVSLPVIISLPGFEAPPPIVDAPPRESLPAVQPEPTLPPPPILPPVLLPPPVVVSADLVRAVESPIEDCICLYVQIRKWGIDRSVPKGFVKSEADEKMVRATKKLIDSREYEAIGKYDRMISDYLDQVSRSSRYIKGARFIKPSMVVPVATQMQAFKEGRKPYVDAFLSEYARLTREAQQLLRGLWNPKQYPTRSEVELKFSVTFDFIKFQVDGRLEEINPELYKAKLEEFGSQMQEIGDELLMLYRAEGLKCLKNLVTRITAPEKGGKKRVLRDGAVENVQDFLRFFDIKDINGDRDLRSLVERARQVLMTGDSYVSADEIRSNDALKESIRRELSEVVTGIEGLMVPAAGRQITFLSTDQ